MNKNCHDLKLYYKLSIQMNCQFEKLYLINLPLTADCEKTSPSVYKNKYKKEDEQIFLH